MTHRSIEKVLSEEVCIEIVKKKLQHDLVDGFSLMSYEIISIDATTGYMGQYFRLKTIIAHDNSPKNTKVINFFTKLPPPQSSPLHEFNEENGSFIKEVDLYTTVFPEVLDGLSKYSIVPECFFASKDDIIVLEDMTSKGFMMTDKFSPFDLTHCIVMMGALAKFHAKSLIFEVKNGTKIDKQFPHCLHETLFPIKEGLGTKMINAAVKGISSMIDIVTDLAEDSKMILKETINKICSNHHQMLLPSKKYKNVLCHGDLWANNILFKYNPNGKPIKCCLIDFQLVRYNPPAHDILCFLQFTTTRKFRDDHADELFRIYYESIVASLTEVGLDYKTILPWEEFQQSIDELRITCMVHGILNITFMLLEPRAIDQYFVSQLIDLGSILYKDRTPLICNEYRSVKRYRERMRDTILELHDRIHANWRA